MPKGYSPAVFVSSTCYDLSQVRSDLKIFIESIGLDPVLSEHNSFPVNPNYDTVSNCLETVKNRADILVLLVGGRYGFQTDTGRSVTNLEYLEAKAKGIPVYIFVHKSILHILPVWEKNKDADFSNIVDTPKLLEFIESLRKEADNWVFAFESSQDIISILKNQLAYLFMDALDLRSRLHAKKLDSEFSDASPRALEILLTKPRGWEYLLFAQMLKDKVNSFRKERFDLLYGVTYGKAIRISNLGELGRWMFSHMNEASRTIKSISKLTNEGIPVAFGAPGVAGDAKHIAYIASRLGDGYKKLIDWTLEFRNIDTEEDYEKVVELGSHITDNAIPEIEKFVEIAYQEINEACSNITGSAERRTIHLILKLTIPDMTEFQNEAARLSIDSDY